MTALNRIEDFLRSKAGRAYCDDCLSEVLNIRPRQQAQQKTSHLARDNRFWRAHARCDRCEEHKIVIRLRMALVSS